MTGAHCTNRWSFLLRISSVNVTKSAGNWKTSFYVQCATVIGYNCLLSHEGVKYELASSLIHREKKCPNTEYFLVCILPYSEIPQIGENTDQKNSVFGHFSKSDWYQIQTNVQQFFMSKKLLNNQDFTF